MKYLSVTFETIEELDNNPLAYSNGFYQHLFSSTWNEIEETFKINVLQKIKKELKYSYRKYSPEKFQRNLSIAYNDTTEALNKCENLINELKSEEDKEFQIELLKMSKKFITLILINLSK